MPDRRGSRFALEVLFLIALAIGLTLAHLDPVEIAGVMLLGWVIVAAIEWAAWREEPHYGSGLPPRYYVPQVSLPPAQPLEQVSAGYPAPQQRDEAPTWIATAADRAEMLGEWPVATPPPSEAEQAEADQRGGAGDDPLDPWLVAELPAEPVAVPQPEAEPEREPEPEPEPELPPAAEAQAETEGESLAAPEPELGIELARSANGVARHHLDPLAEPAPRRRFARGAAELPPAVEVPARPVGARALPGRSNRQD
jgi:hypothetical protein